MWNKHGQEGLVFHEYRLKETGEYVEQAVCPKCELDMVVLEHIFEGIDKKDDRIEDTTVRDIFLYNREEDKSDDERRYQPDRRI